MQNERQNVITETDSSTPLCSSQRNVCSPSTISKLNYALDFLFLCVVLKDYTKIGWFHQFASRDRSSPICVCFQFVALCSYSDKIATQKQPHSTTAGFHIAVLFELAESIMNWKYIQIGELRSPFVKAAKKTTATTSTMVRRSARTRRNEKKERQPKENESIL